MQQDSILFITGGVRSGKSSYAERLAIKDASERNLELHYVACGIPFDYEMKERILRHQQDRSEQGIAWKTWEKPVKLVELAPKFTKNDLVLVDCLTTLLNNYFFEGNKLAWDFVLEQIKEDIRSLIERARQIIFVSNEVLVDLPYQNHLTRNYQYILGQLHQYLVKESDAAILVENGIPIFKKGSWN